MASPSESEVAAFEAHIGASLSADYRSYLLITNGGAPEKSSYKGEVMDLYLQYFFPLCASEDEGLRWEWQVAPRPETFRRILLPIATVNGGDRLYLSLVTGEIFFHDHELDAFTRIDDSFSSVLQNSHEE